jgi:hypothetical protein
LGVESSNYIRTYPKEYNDKQFEDPNHVVNWSQYSKDFGWVCDTNQRPIKFTNMLYNSGIEYSINDIGFRSNNYTQFDCDKNILVLGDSYVFGVYLNDSETIPFYIQKSISIENRVYNFGMPGWGIDQMYLCYQKYQNVFSPEKIVLIFIEDDIDRVLEAYRYLEGMNKPSFKIENNELLLRDRKERTFIELIFQKSKLLNPFYIWFCKNEAVKITKLIFSSMKNLTKNNNQEFLVFYIPLIEQVLYPNQYEKLIDNEFNENNNINYYDLTEYFEKLSAKSIQDLYLVNDGHLSQKGTEFVAEIITKEIIRK